MIDNFTPQSFPLEARTENGVTLIVIGWRRAGGSTEVGRLEPVAVRRGEPSEPRVWSGPLTYRSVATEGPWPITTVPSWTVVPRSTSP